MFLAPMILLLTARNGAKMKSMYLRNMAPPPEATTFYHFGW
jgi:hypothetical protein